MQITDPAQLLKDANLTPRQLRCMAAYFFDGMSAPQIGQVLGISRQAVEKHISAGQARLKAAGLPEAQHVKVERGMHTMNPQDMDRLGPERLRAIF